MPSAFAHLPKCTPGLLDRGAAVVGIAMMPSVAKMRHSGLTLLELVLVVAIAAILATLALGQYNQYIEGARGKAATGEIVMISTEVERYRTSHDGVNPDTLSDMGRGGMLDPWRRPYFYTNLATAKGKGSARKDRRLNPLNSDYDLFSAGRDGVFKPQISQKDSLDDIIRARDGAFVGRASEF